MSGRSRKSSQPTLWDTADAISSQESPAGNSPCGSQAGQRSEKFGPARVHASPLVSQADEKAKRTKDTSGRCSFGSSESAALQRSLASRLLLTTDTDGSPEYEMTWKKRAMQSGAPICRLAARARRTSANAYSGWPTPDAQSFGTHDSRWEERREEIKAKGINGNGFGLTLGMAATLAGWPTPDTGSEGGRVSKDPAAKKRPSGTKKQFNLNDAAVLAGWATPTASEKVRSEEFQRGRELNPREALAGWATPTEINSRTEATPAQIEHMERQRRERPKGAPSNLAIQVALASGPDQPSSTAETARLGVLNPAFSLWLMGFPAAWVCCGVRAMQSCRKPPRTSSKRSSKKTSERKHRK